MKETKKPLVSVVMPSYNHARFIGRAVESVLGQTFRDLELIVVDNNSADGTAEILAAVQDPRLRVVEFSNGGIIAASRNLGIKSAAGEYVAFMDSDDVWLPEKLARQVEVLDADSGAALCYCRFRTLQDGEESDRTLPRLEICAKGMAFRQLYLRPFIACSGVLARKADLAAAGGFSQDPALLAAEDMDLWLRLAASKKIALASQEPLLLYRVHAGAASSGHFKRFRRAACLALRHGRAAGPLLFCASLVLALGSVGRDALGALKGGGE